MRTPLFPIKEGKRLDEIPEALGAGADLPGRDILVPVQVVQEVQLRVAALL